METIINTGVIGFTILVIIIIEKFMYRTPPTEQESEQWQKSLDKMDTTTKRCFNVSDDAMTAILCHRNHVKGLTLMFLALLLAILWLYVPPSFKHTMVFPMCISTILLTCYGLCKCIYALFKS